MGTRKTYHVTADGDDWRVKAEGAQRASGVRENKADAVDLARELAKNQDQGQVVVHRADGRIQTEYTYGKDPYPPKG